MKSCPVIFFFLAASVLISGCAAVTEPFGLEDPFAIPPAFEDVQRNQEMLNPGLNITSVVVELPRGVDTALASELQSKIIRGLDERDIAAQTSSTGRSWVLKGRAVGYITNETTGIQQRVVVWRVFNQEKKLKGQFTTAFSGKSAGDIEPRLGVLASSVSAQVFAIVSPASSVQPVNNGSKATISVVMGSVKGATGDGNVALARALKGALAAKGVEVLLQSSDPNWRVECEVKVTKLNAKEDRVVIVWRLVDPQQKEAGKLTQDNSVPKGRLAKSWGEVAEFAADAAADGINQILQQIRGNATR